MRFVIRDTNLTRKLLTVDINVENENESFIQLIESKSNHGEPVGTRPMFPDNAHLRYLAEQAWQGIKKGHNPVLCQEGVGGTYFFRNSQNQNVGVFKPNDEEPFTINNPKGYTPPSSPSVSSSPFSFGASSYGMMSSSPSLSPQAGYKQGILAGEASIRECAAYLLDHDHFAGVPETDMAVAQHPIFHTNQNYERPRSASMTLNSAIDSSFSDRPRAFSISPSLMISKSLHTDRSPSSYNNSGFGGKTSDPIKIGETTGTRGVAAVSWGAKTPLRIQTSMEQAHDEVKLKFGSFQAYKEHDGDTEDISPNFIAKFPMHEVHKIAVLDIRLLNTDRHGGNILFKHTTKEHGQRTITLIPIDHGYTLPSSFADIYFVWLNFPQSKQKMDPRTRSYIDSLDVSRDIEILQKKFGKKSFTNEHFRNMRIAFMWLQKGSKADLTLYQIGDAMCRMDVSVTQSLLERMCFEAARIVLHLAGRETNLSFQSTPHAINDDLDVEQILLHHHGSDDEDESTLSSGSNLSPTMSEDSKLEDDTAEEAPDVALLLNQIAVQLEPVFLDELSHIMDREIERISQEAAAN